jgi:hypothetical protein
MGSPGTLRSFSASSRKQESSRCLRCRAWLARPAASSATEITDASVLLVLARPHPMATAGNGGRGRGRGRGKQPRPPSRSLQLPEITDLGMMRTVGDAWAPEPGSGSNHSPHPLQRMAWPRADQQTWGEVGPTSCAARPRFSYQRGRTGDPLTRIRPCLARRSAVPPSAHTVQPLGS